MAYAQAGPRLDSTGGYVRRTVCGAVDDFKTRKAVSNQRLLNGGSNTGSARNLYNGTGSNRVNVKNLKRIETCTKSQARIAANYHRQRQMQQNLNQPLTFEMEE